MPMQTKVRGMETRKYRGWSAVGTAVLAIMLIGATPTASAQQGDPVLIQIVESEYTTVDQFLSALTQLESALREHHDARLVFAAVYRVLTTHAKEDVEEGLFDDSEWATALTVNFGNRYRQAFYDYEIGNLGDVPIAWKIAFDAAAAENATVFQLALLGVHAHVNRDLPYAIAAVTPNVERERRFQDYVVTNDLVVGAILDIERLLGQEFAPALANLDEALGDFDAELLRIVLSQWRYRAWRNAQLFDVTLPGQYRTLFGWFLEIQTGYRAHVIAIGVR